MIDSTVTRSSTVSDIVRRSGARFGDKVAVRFADREWTYRQLDAAVTRVAHHLSETLGIPPRARIATLGKNSDAYLITFLACARAGYIHVPLNYNLLGRELDRVLDAEAESGQVARERRDDADLHDLLVAPAVAVS